MWYKDFEVEEIEGVYTIVDYRGDNKQVVIPDKINGKMVTSIGKCAFKANHLTSIIIPNGVTCIERGAFSENHLTEVIIPESVTFIGSSAFSENQNITIKGETGSEAEEYANDNGIPFEVITKINPSDTAMTRTYAHISNGRPTISVKDDIVNKASHYNSTKFEVIEIIEEFELGFHLGNTIKYVLRSGLKDVTKDIEDLEKAEYYLRRHIENLKKKV